MQAIQDLRPREAFIHPAHGAATKVTTRRVPDPLVSPELLAGIEQQYLATSFTRPPATAAPSTITTAPTPASLPLSEPLLRDDSP